MKRSEYYKKRDELSEKISTLRDKKKELREKYEDSKFEKEKRNIERYYINSYRRANAGVFLLVSDKFTKNHSGGAFVQTVHLRLVTNDEYFSVEVIDRPVTLRQLRNTDPIDKKEIKERLQEAEVNMIQQIADNFNIQIN